MHLDERFHLNLIGKFHAELPVLGARQSQLQQKGDVIVQDILVSLAQKLLDLLISKAVHHVFLQLAIALDQIG